MSAAFRATTFSLWETSPTASRTALAALANVALCLTLLALWLPLFLLCAYASPALDDFVEATWTDFWAVQSSRYAGYTGRFIGSAVQAINPWHWQSLDGYRMSAVARLLLFVGSLATFAVAVNRVWL